MRITSPFLASIAVLLLSTASAFAADTTAAGRVKSIDSEKKEFVLTDSAGKDWTIKLGDKLTINRGGKESKSDLNVGDMVNVGHDKGVFTWTAHYILVQEGETKDSVLVHGTVKQYDADKKELIFTDAASKDWVFPMGSARVRLNMEDSKIGDVKIGDRAMLIVGKVADVPTLKCLMIDRK